MRHETFSFCVLVNDLLCTGRREDLMWLKRQFLKEYALETNLMGEDDDMEKKAVSLGRGENGIGIRPDRRHVRSLLPELGWKTVEVSTPQWRKEIRHERSCCCCTKCTWPRIVWIWWVAKFMAIPREGDDARLNCVARYLHGHGTQFRKKRKQLF